MKKIIVDTNILLLLIIGAVENGSFIQTSNRLKSFNHEDYSIILNFLADYKKGKQYITPYIATEISNLIDLKGDAKSKAYQSANLCFSEFIQIDVDIKDDSASPYFPIFGITDTSLIHLSKEFEIFTNDERLVKYIYEFGGNPDNILPYYLVKQTHKGNY